MDIGPPETALLNGIGNPTMSIFFVVPRENTPKRVAPSQVAASFSVLFREG